MIEEVNLNENTHSNLVYKLENGIIIQPHVSENIYSISNPRDNKRIVLSLSNKENDDPLFLIPSEQVDSRNSPKVTVDNDILKVNIGEISDYIDELELARIGLIMILEKAKTANPKTVQSGYDFLDIISKYLDRYYEENSKDKSKNKIGTIKSN